MNEILAEISAAIGIPIHEWAVLHSDKLIFSHDLLEYCKTNACGLYNKSWTCPPACETLEEQRKKILSYKNVLVFTTIRKLEDSFDFENMTIARDDHILLTAGLSKRLGDNPVYGAGHCPICKTCAFPDPCLFPEKKIGSIEAAGIDVTALSKAAGIKYHNGQNTVTFFSMILI